MSFLHLWHDDCTLSPFVSHSQRSPAPPTASMHHGFSQHLSQRQTQSLVLAPQLRQSLKILQVAALDLRATIAEELQSNPVLEELPMEGLSLERTQADSDPGPDTDPREQLAFDKEFEILARMGEDFKDSFVQHGDNEPYSNDAAERRQHFFDSLVGEESLQEHLLAQAALADCSPAVREAVRYLVGSLDDRGFLSSPLADLALLASLPLETLQEGRKLLTGFDPLGIGALDLPECLLLQLQAKGRGTSIAARIVRDHFALLIRRRMPDIARKMGLPIEEIQKAIEVIGTLDPAPGRRFAQDDNRIVVPDVSVEKVGGEWVITLHDDYIPRVRLSRAYKDLIAKGTLTDAERAYLREKMRAGKFLINSIEQRQRTIERITREILTAQQPFFEEGLSKLRPLTMMQIADIVGVHETTVSRALANKYIRTPHGVFPLKFFFTSGYRAQDGADVSNTSVKDMIKALIEDEDTAKPRSDQELVGLLTARGIPIARRTVAKYRDELGLLPSNLRRHYQ